MVNPVTGPIPENTAVTGSQAGSGFTQRQRYRQALPIDRPLPYTMHSAWKRGNSQSGNAGGRNLQVAITATSISTASRTAYLIARKTQFPDIEREATLVLERARVRFVSGLGDRAESVVNALEFGKNLAAIRSSAHAAGIFAKAIARRDFAQVRKYARKAGYRGIVKDASSAWLAFFFGVKPLMSDVSTAAKRLSSELPEGFWKSSATGRVTRTYQSGGPLPSQLYSHTLRGVLRGRVGGMYRISNPNAFLAQRLGLTNLPSILWELVPWSFVVDWWVNVGGFIASLDDLLGVTVSKSYNSIGWKGTSYFHHKQGLGANAAWAAANIDTVSVVRALGVPSPRMSYQVNAFANSQQRAANAVALLLQFLPTNDPTGRLHVRF